MTGDGQDRAGPAAWYGLFVLFVAYTFSFIDRSILSLMVEPIKADLKLSDTEISLLHGFAFAIFYTFLGIPIARLADSRSRTKIIAWGIVVWSTMTALCGLANRFATLFLARVGVGVGEAALSPAAYSLLTDLFPRRQLGLAMGLYSAGVYVGAGLAFLIGGYAVQAAIAHGPVAVPVIGELRPWQLIFVIVGLPGLLVAGLMLTVREPARPVRRITGTQAGVGAVWRLIQQEPRTFLSHFIGFSLLGLLFNAFLAWAPAFFMRVHGLSTAGTGALLGSLIILFGSAGIVAGGIYSDRLIQKGRTAGPILSARLAAVVLLPLAVAAPLAGTLPLAACLFAAFFFFAAFPYGSAAAAIQMAAPAHLRAQVSAIYLFVLNLTGMGVGPTLVALVTDLGFGDPRAVGQSMAIVGLVSAPLGALVLHGGARAFSASVAQRQAKGV